MTQANKIRTNRLKVDINFDAIMTDFDIYIIENKSAKLERTNLLDIPTDEFKALSVQYSFGAKAIALFKKNSVDEIAFRNRITGESDEATVRRITPNELNDKEHRYNYFYGLDVLLVQLLFNSMMNIKMDSLMYSNLTGKLLYPLSNKIVRDKVNKEQINFMSFLEIKLDPGMFLNLGVKTFKREDYDTVYANADGKPVRVYILDSKTGKLRKKLKTDERCNSVYTEGSFYKKHVTVDFLDIMSYRKFQNSKLGIMRRFIEDAKKILGRYLTIEFSNIEENTPYEITRKEKKGLTEQDIGAYLNRRGVNIVDDSNTEKSREIIEKLSDELVRFYGVSPTEGVLSAEKFNIRIIHEPEYYEENKLPDPYKDIPSGYIIQHMTEEGGYFEEEKPKKKKSDNTNSDENNTGEDNSVEGELIEDEPVEDEPTEGNSDENNPMKKEPVKRNSPTPAVHKIVQELVIKEDVANEQISIFDWSRLDSDKEWTFVTRKKLKKEKDEKGKYQIKYSYQVLKIDRNGKMDFSMFDDKAVSYTELQNKIRAAYAELGKSYKYPNTIEALAFSDANNIQAVIATPERTLPNIDAIAEGLKETDRKRRISCEEISEGINAFIEYAKLSDDEIGAFNKLKKQLEESITGEITISEIRKALGMGKKISKEFNRFMHSNYSIWISPEMKDRTFDEQFMLDNILNIKYYQQRDYEGYLGFYYYVGTKRESLQNSVHNACMVRKVVSQKQDGPIEYAELLPLMTVDFVKNKQYTVLPFPFKYLREWTLRNYKAVIEEEESAE